MFTESGNKTTKTIASTTENVLTTSLSLGSLKMVKSEGTFMMLALDDQQQAQQQLTTATTLLNSSNSSNCCSDPIRKQPTSLSSSTSSMMIDAISLNSMSGGGFCGNGETISRKTSTASEYTSLSSDYTPDNTITSSTSTSEFTLENQQELQQQPSAIPTTQITTINNECEEHVENNPIVTDSVTENDLIVDNITTTTTTITTKTITNFNSGRKISRFLVNPVLLPMSNNNLTTYKVAEPELQQQPQINNEQQLQNKRNSDDFTTTTTTTTTTIEKDEVKPTPTDHGNIQYFSHFFNNMNILESFVPKKIYFSKN